MAGVPSLRGRRGFWTLPTTAASGERPGFVELDPDLHARKEPALLPELLPALLPGLECPAVLVARTLLLGFRRSKSPFPTRTRFLLLPFMTQRA